MAGVRMTGLISGMDTESLVKQLADAYQVKVDNAKKKQTKAEWKKEAWASLNTKLLNFYRNALTTFKSTGTYSTKAINGNLTGVKISAGLKAVNGNHKIKVEDTASAQMWTGHQINKDKYTATSYVRTSDSSKKLSEVFDQNGYSIQNALNGASFTVKNSDDPDAEEVNVNISVDENTTIQGLVDSINTQLDGTGLTASFTEGALTFTNTTAVETEGTFSGGNSITVTADNKTSATALGLPYNENGSGMKIAPKGDSIETNDIRGSVFAYEKKETEGSVVTGSTKLVDLGIKSGTTIKVNNTEIAVDNTTTLNSLASAMEKAGISANYDANQGRFYLSSKKTGTENGFTVEVKNPDGTEDVDNKTLKALGLDLKDGEAGKIVASDAKIIYNGVEYIQSSNSFSINGLTIDVSSKGEEQSFSVETDVDGIYDKVKNFVKEYNELIAEMNKLYNADSSRGYEPLTSEEKDAMTEEDAEKWETKIKDSLLRRDSTISSLLSSMRTTLNKSVAVTNADGTTTRYALSSFGIVTGGYTEKGQLHINGNSDDPEYADKEDKLKAAIAANPDALIKTLTTLGNEMYTNLQKAQKSIINVRSTMTFYNDKQMDGEIRDLKKNVTSLQDKLAEEEDKYYKQFSGMETALARLQSQQNYIAQLFGG